MRNKTILFVCKANSGRSQIAEAFFNSLSGEGKAISAGTDPDKEIHPWTVKVMKEIGIDVSQQKPKLLSKGVLERADKIIVMEQELLKDIPSRYHQKLEGWRIGKLLGKSTKEVRKIRDQIKKRVGQLLVE